MRRLRAVAVMLLQLLLAANAARLDSGDFGSVLGQITKGNKMEQCPCVRPPEGGACISYDSRYQASHVEEAMISFVDLSLPDRERPTDADSLACVSAECRACFSLLFYRILEVGLLPRTYRPSIPVLPQANLKPSMCPRLRFPSPDDFSTAATAALASTASSAAIAGLIERGHRFERSAQAAEAASAALSHLKDLQVKRGHHHGHRDNSRDRQNNNNNNNNPSQTQVPAAPQREQGRTGASTPSPTSRQFTVQQQLRVQQPSWQQQQQLAQQAQQARLQAQQQQFAQQQQLQLQQQQQQFQQQQFQNQQFQNQQFQNQQFANQFNQQQTLNNAARFLQTARQINSLADTISMATHAAHSLNRWREGYEHGGPRPNPGPGPGPNPGPGPRPDPGPGGPRPGGSHESHGSGESGEHHGHHHHHHQHPGHPQHPQHPQHPFQQFIPGQQQGGGPQVPFGNEAHTGIGGPPQGGFPGPFPGNPFPGSGGIGGGHGEGGGGFGGGWGGGIGGWRKTRSSPLDQSTNDDSEDRRRRAVLASQTGGADQKVEMEVVSPPVSPLIPKELRPMPVEVTFNHDGEHIFSEERSAFAELTRDKRQSEQRADDGMLGSRFTIGCYAKGESENGGDDKMLSLCGGCWVWRRLPEGFFPPILNELVCKKEDRCLSGWGRCVDKTRSVNVLRKVRGQWTAATLSTGTCCDCKVVAGSEIHSLIVG